MTARVLFLLACLVAHATCGRSSLTFVIDETASMHDEIRQVKDAAKSIADIVLSHQSSQIEDIVLVTFNDPGTVLRQKTRDAEQFKEALSSIVINGGADCQEPSLSGIKTGLEESRPGSYLYVFTDASAKDHAKFQEVKALCQEKEIQIGFILTGDCGDRSQESYRVYQKIAVACNGQVFDIKKNEVKQVLENVKETIKGDRVVISSTTLPAYTWRDIKFDIDELTQNAIVSASGSNVVLKILDQNYSNINGTLITWTQNVKILSLANISPGSYTARVRGNSELHVMIAGRPNFTFKYRFSTKDSPDTHLQPSDSPNHLLVFAQGNSQPVVVRRVEILDMQDRLIKILPVTLAAKNVYRTEEFSFPQNFKITVVAMTTTGSEIKLSANVPFTQRDPDLYSDEDNDATTRNL